MQLTRQGGSLTGGYRALFAGAGPTCLTLACLALSGCVAPPQGPPPAPAPAPAPPPPAPAPTPTPAPQPAPAPFAGSWLDAPQTPGDWRYSRDPEDPITEAEFVRDGTVVFRIACTIPARTVQLGPFAVRGSAATGAPMTLRSEFGDRTLETRPLGGVPFAVLPASDPVLDAIAFTKGRFAVEIPGLESLYLPAWPEVIRVIEDCR